MTGSERQRETPSRIDVNTSSTMERTQFPSLIWPLRSCRALFLGQSLYFARQKCLTDPAPPYIIANPGKNDQRLGDSAVRIGARPPPVLLRRGTQFDIISGDSPRENGGETFRVARERERETLAEGIWATVPDLRFFRSAEKAAECCDREAEATSRRTVLS